MPMQFKIFIFFIILIFSAGCSANSSDNIKEIEAVKRKLTEILHSEINPGLASHGGMVNLVEVEDEVAVLQFGGGCQGCGMVDMTLKDGVEKTLLESLPQLKGVRDVTDHSVKENAYF